MQDITDEMLFFKDAIRHSWNTYFVKCGCSLMSPEIQEAFGEVERGLLRGIVLASLHMPQLADDYRQKPLPWLIVKQPVGRELTLQIGRVDGIGNTCWDQSHVLTTNDNSSLEFFDFFDWNFYGMVDFPYVRVRISNLSSKPEAQGAMALIEQHSCRFFLSHPNIQ